MNWNEYFMRFAILAAQKSKCATQMGAVLVLNKMVVSTGYNGIPMGVNDPNDYSDELIELTKIRCGEYNIPFKQSDVGRILERKERPEKYFWECHAELNCLLFACRNGVKTLDSSMYVIGKPCATCARSIIQAGVKNVFVIKSYIMNGWEIEQVRSLQMFKEAGVKFIELDIYCGLELRQDGKIVKV